VTALLSILYVATIPSISNKLTSGRSSGEEFDPSDEVLIDTYSWDSAPWGHASLNVSGTVYNQGGAEQPEGSSGMLWGQGFFIRKPQSVWYGGLQRDNVVQTLQRYAISVNAQQRQFAKNYLDNEFNHAQIVDLNHDGTPDFSPETTRLRDYHFLWGNCATTTTSAMPWWTSVGVPIVGYFSPHHLAASLNLQSLLPWSKVRRLNDKVY
jgi:hypothetical protein